MKRLLKYGLIATGITTIIFILFVYRIFFEPSVKISQDKTTIYIPSGAAFEQVIDSLSTNLQVGNQKLLRWVAERKKYPVLIKPGRYVIDNDLSYNSLIDQLRSGRQSPVNVTFNNVRTLNDLAGKVGGTIEADSAEIIAFLSDPENYLQDGFKKETIIAVFIPNTYEFFWNTSASQFYDRMLKEYKKFWNEKRMSQAREKNLSLIEVSILASIIDDEVLIAEEKPRIAGVYLNRIRRGIPLQACPTIKFALNDFTITRVLTKHLSIESPYNTYKYSGFPPGPIGCPSIQGIDAVLNAEKHDFLYFAAKADFSGHHNFSRTLSEHNRYAAEYQRELNRRRIYR